MKPFLILCILVIAGCMGANAGKINLAATGMTRQEIVQLMGDPDSAAARDGSDYLFYRVHDHAFGRDKNNYFFQLRDNRLVAFGPLPPDQQDREEGFRELVKRRLEYGRPH